MKRELVSRKEFRRKSSSKDESAFLYADGYKCKGDVGKPQTTAYKPFGIQRREKKESVFDSKEQQVMVFVKKSILAKKKKNLHWRYLFIFVCNF